MSVPQHLMSDTAEFVRWCHHDLNFDFEGSGRSEWPDADATVAYFETDDGDHGVEVYQEATALHGGRIKVMRVEVCDQAGTWKVTADATFRQHFCIDDGALTPDVHYVVEDFQGNIADLVKAIGWMTNHEERLDAPNALLVRK